MGPKTQYVLNAVKHTEQLIFATYTRAHNPSFVTKIILSDDMHVLRQRSHDRFRALPRNMLWVHVSANSLPAIVCRRAACRRLIRAILRVELARAGFDLNAILWMGKRAEMMSRENRNRNKNKGAYWKVRGAAVTGTLDIKARERFLDADPATIEEHIRAVVNDLKNHTSKKIST